MKNTFYVFALLFCVLNLNAQIVDIPDEGFKAVLIDQGIDTNTDGEIQTSEAEQVETLSIDGTLYDINLLEGIKSLRNLISLTIFAVNANEIDVSGMTNLEYLDIDSYESSNIFAVGCTSLKELKSVYFEKEIIDLTNCTSLELLPITFCSNNLILANCSSIKRLNMEGCMLNEIDLSGCTSISYFNMFSDNIENLNLSGLISLDTFILSGFSQLNLDLVDLPSLTYIELEEVNTTYIRECPLLSVINIIGSISVVDLVDLPSLSIFNYNGFNTETLKVINCPALSTVEFDFADINNLILNNCGLITEVNIINGIMPDFADFSGMSGLKNLSFSSGPRELILDGCYSLENFTVQDFSAAEAYDFSPCINLKEVNLSSCFDLKTLILQNGSLETITMTEPFNLSNVCVDPSEFIQMQAYLTTFENLDVEVTTFCEFASGGEPFVFAGTSYLDVNNDSCATSDVILPYSKYVITDDIIGDRYFYTDAEGNFNFNVIEGQYTIGPELLFGDYIFTTYPENLNVDFPSDGTAVNQDFCFIPNPAEVDIIEVNLIPLEVARPGFDASYLITYTNTGNVTRGGDIKLTFQDEFMEFLFSEPMVSMEEEGFLFWSFEDLVPFETRSIEFSMNLNSPMDTPPLNGADIISFTAEVGPIGNQTLTVYWSYLNQEIVNSFDPNDKTCLNGNTFDQELVGDYLKYMIRFENTGSAEAVNIVVSDTLDDTKFDVRTLQVINSSHEVETELTGNIVKFFFRDIYLPFNDATNDGYVTFKLKTLPTLAIGDDIRNKAEIFFDFNFPIITNTTSTVISDFTGTIDEPQNNFELSISPNPALENITIISEEELVSIELMDLSGRLLEWYQFAEGKFSHSLNIKYIKPGIYLIKVYSEQGFSTKKLIKE